MKTPSTLRALLLGASFLAAPCVQAATYYWDIDGATAGSGGTTPSGTWSTGGTTWTTDSTGTTATSALTTTFFDDLFFSAGTDATGAYAISLNSTTQNARLVTFEDGTATLTAATGTLSLGTGGGITVTTNTVTGSTISCNLTLSGAQTFNVVAGRTLTLASGTFTRNAGSTLNILSTGTVTTTMTNLAAGSLVNGIIGPWASFGTGASTKYATIDGSNNIVGLTGTAAATAANVTDTTGVFNYDVAAVGTLGASANINTLRYTGAAGTIAGALTTKGIMNVSGNALTFSGTVSGGGELVVNTANGNVTFSSVLTSGTTSLVKDGPGRLGLMNAATTFTGTVTVNGGVLQYGDTISQLTSGNITLNGGVIEQRWTESITKTQGSGVGQIQILGGDSGFSENGATGLTWNIGAVTWGSSTFNPTKFLLQTASSQNGSSITFSSAIDLNGAVRTIVASAGAGTATSTMSGALTGTGASGLIKEGTGNLILSNTGNTYSGTTTISAGTLSAAGTGSLGNSSATNTLIFNGGTLRATGAITSVATRSVTMTATGIIDNNGQAISIAGNIGGAGGLTKNGTGTLTLSGTNSYGGVTTVNAGTLAFSNQAALYNATPASWTAANINVKSGATLQLNVDSAGTAGFTVANLDTLLGNIFVANTAAEGLQAGASLSLDTSTASGATFTQGNAITNSTGAFGGLIGFTKLGAGTLIFDKANTYTGATTISAGTLQLNAGGVIATPILNNATFAINSAGVVTQGTNFGFIGGTGNLTKAGAGTLTLNHLNNTYTGDTTVTGGTIVMGHALALQNSAYDTASVAGGLDVTGYTSPILGGLTGSGNLTSSLITGYGSITNLTLNPQSGITKTYSGNVGLGAGTMSLTKTGAGTQILTGTNTYTGTTFLNAGALHVGTGASIGRITGTTDLNFNGGTLQFNRSTAADIAAINNAATITVNASSTFGVTSNDTGGASANETIGAVTLNAGQMNFNWTNSPSSGSQIILTSLSRSGTASANFNGLHTAGGGRWRVTGAGTTTAGQIIGPWYTTGGNNAGFASTDYAVYSSDFIAAAGIAGSAETTWTTAANAYTTSAGGTVTLTATRTITALRNTGATTVLTLATGANLETYGLLNGVATLLTVAPGTGGFLTTPTGGGNLYINAGAGAITVSAAINNNGVDAVTLVKNGSGTLTLTSTTSNFSGGVVLNSGTLSIDDVRSIGGINNTGGSTAPITVNGSSTISMPSNNLIANFGTGAITINNGATLTVSSVSRGDLRFGGAVTGSGGVTALSGSFWAKYSFTSTSNTFTGAITDSRSGNDGVANALFSFNSIADGAGYGNIILNGAADSGIDYGSGAITALNLNYRQLILANNNTIFFNNASSQAVNINTDIGFSGTGARQIRFGISGRSGTGVSTFAGNLTDNVGGVFSPTVNGGNWVFSNSANTYTGVTGVTSVTGSTLVVTSLANGLSASSIGASSNAAGNLILNGGTLRYTGGAATTDRLFSVGTSSGTINSSGTGAVNFTNTGTMGFNAATGARTLTLTGTNTGNNTLAAVIGDNTGATAVTKTSIGTWVLSAANTYTGVTTLQGGGTTVLDYGTSDTSKFSDTVSALALGGTGVGGGTLTLNGATGSHIEIVTSTSLNAGGTFLTRSGANTAKLRMNVITRAVGGTISFGSATLADTDTVNINSILGGFATLDNDWAVSAASGTDIAVTALASYTTWVNSTGSSTANYLLNGAGSIVTAGVAANTVKITNSANSETLALNNLNLTITSASATSLGGIMYAGGSDNLYSITGGTGRIVTSTVNQELIFAVQTGTLSVGAFVGASGSTGPVTKTGAGTLAISSLNNYTGATYVNQGVLQLRSATAAGTATNTLNAGIIVQNNAALELANSAIIGTEALTITGTGVSNGGALRNVASNTSSYAGAITIGTGGARINSDATGINQLTLSGGVTTSLFNDVTFGGAGNTTVQTVAISGAGGLIKDGAGTTTLATGTTNTYTGATTVSDGTLFVNGSISSSSLTTVASTATIGGNGTVGALTVSSGGFISGGDSGDNTSVLNINGAYSQAGLYTAHIAGTGAGNFDQLNVTGAVNITGGSLTVMFTGGSYTNGDLIFILLSGSGITGEFSGFANGATVLNDGTYNWNISYFADSGTTSFTGGNDIALQAVLIPEPKTALLGCLGVLLLLRRRR